MSAFGEHLGSANLEGFWHNILTVSMQRQSVRVSLTEACGRQTYSGRTTSLVCLPAKFRHALRPHTRLPLDRRQCSPSSITRRNIVAAVNKDTDESACKPKKVVGMGGVGVDYLASVAAYPEVLVLNRQD